MTDDRNLAQRLHAAMASIGDIEKTGTMEGHGNYKFVEGAVVARKVREACLREGIVVLASSRDARNVGEIMSRNNVKQTITRIDMDIRFINIDDPQDSYYITSTADGLDDMDKGVPKAVTGALKSGLRNAFLIADANDPERDQGGAAPTGYPVDPQLAAFLAAQEAAAQPPVATSIAVEQPIPQEPNPDSEPVGVLVPKRTRAPRKPKDPAPVAEQVAGAVEQPIALASDAKKALARARQHEAGLTDGQFKAMAGMVTKKGSSTEWTDADADTVIAALASPLAAAFLQMDPVTA